MDLKKELEQRKEFRDILNELAKSQIELQDAHYRSDMYKRLESLYDAETPDKRFRHFYSDIFSILTAIQQNPDLGDINILGQNLALIRSGYQPKNKAPDGKRIIDIGSAIKKLYDHVSLDIARLSYSDGADRQVSGEAALENLQSQINLLQKELPKAQSIKGIYDDTKQDLDKVQNELANSKKEYIAILGIFSSVVLTFTGGIAFSTSVLNNIAQASIYRTVFISLIIGLVLVNVLFGLFYYINSLVNKKKKIIPLIVSNIVIIALLITTGLAWHCGWVENRNKRIENENKEAVIEEMIVNSQNADFEIEETALSE